MLTHYLKVSFREGLKYKMQSIISIVGLAIGFTAFVLGSYWLWWETHFDNFHPDGERLYCLTTTGLVKKATGADADLDQLHVNDLAEIQKLLPEIEQVCTFAYCFYSAKRNSGSQTLYGLICDQRFFDFFKADFIAGTNKGYFPDGKTVILTESTAKQFFGTTDCIGKVFDLDEHNQPLVGGVIKNYPDNSDLIFQFLLIDQVKPIPHANRNTTYIRLLPGTDVDKVKKKLAGYKSHADDPWGIDHVDQWKINLRTPSEVHLHCHPELESRIRNVHILALAGLMVFLSALMNLLVLFIGQQQRKQQKNRTYLCIGASPKQMLLKGWTELFIPMFIAYLLAFCLIEIIFPYYESYTAWNHYGIYEGVSRHIDSSALTLNAVIALAAGTLLFWLVTLLPVRRIVSNKSNPVIFKRGLIVGQVFIGSLFFITSLVLLLQLNFILTKDKGLDYKNVLQVDMGFENAYQNDARVLIPELQSNPYITDVCYTAVNGGIFTEQGDWYGTMNIHLSFDPAEEDHSRSDQLMVVSKDFFTFFGMTLKEGRWIDESNPDCYVVNETGAKILGYKDLLNRTIYSQEGATNQKVTGIVKDYIYAPMQYPVQKTFFRLHTDEDTKNFTPVQYFYVRYLPEHKKEVLDYIADITQKLNVTGVSRQNMCVELTDLVDKFNRPEKIIFSLFSIIAFICILISTFGIYSLVSLSAQQRKKEIAIRKVNGASLMHILQLFIQEYLLLVIAGNLFALPIGYIQMKRWLETYANHIDLTIWPFIAVLLITCLIVLLSVLGQVKKAAQANPAEAIKSE